MTAEVALLNHAAVALAADSAMTLASGKTYPAQKLFALSKRHPVGLMIYNNAEFMGIPWETLIKMYRSSLDDDPRPTLQGYLDEFLKFIAQRRFITAGQEILNLWSMVSGLFQDVLRRAEEGTNDLGALTAEIDNAKSGSRASNGHRQ